MYQLPPFAKALAYRIWMGQSSLIPTATLYHSSGWWNLNGSVKSQTAREAENLNEPMQYYTICHHKLGQFQTWITLVLDMLEKICLQFWNAQCILHIFNELCTVQWKAAPMGIQWIAALMKSHLAVFLTIVLLTISELPALSLFFFHIKMFFVLFQCNGFWKVNECFFSLRVMQ